MEQPKRRYIRHNVDEADGNCYSVCYLWNAPVAQKGITSGSCRSVSLACRASCWNPGSVRKHCGSHSATPIIHPQTSLIQSVTNRPSPLLVRQKRHRHQREGATRSDPMDQETQLPALFGMKETVILIYVPVLLWYERTLVTAGRIREVCGAYYTWQIPAWRAQSSAISRPNATQVEHKRRANRPSHQQTSAQLSRRLPSTTIKHPATPSIRHVARRPSSVG